MKNFLFAILCVGLMSSATFAQAWRPKPTQRTTTTTTTRVYTTPAPSTRVVVRTHRTKRTGIPNARAHGGVAHAYGHYKKGHGKGHDKY